MTEHTTGQEVYAADGSGHHTHVVTIPAAPAPAPTPRPRPAPVYAFSDEFTGRPARRRT